MRSSQRAWLVVVAALGVFAAGCGRGAVGGPAVAVTTGPRPTATSCDKCGKERDKTPTPKRPAVVTVGLLAPDFVLHDLAGEPHALSDYTGQVVLLNFWATWCGPCRAELPDLVQAQKTYGSHGFTVVAVNLGEPRERVRAFAEQHGITFPVLLDGYGTTDSKFMTRAIPTSVVLDRDGVVRKIVMGSLDGDSLASLIEPLLAN
ncbi:MAG: TlpA family protein disulfide reductase [Anaerolineae bacterium]